MLLYCLFSFQMYLILVSNDQVILIYYWARIVIFHFILQVSGTELLLKAVIQLEHRGVPQSA